MVRSRGARDARTLDFSGHFAFEQKLPRTETKQYEFSSLKYTKPKIGGLPAVPEIPLETSLFLSLWGTFSPWNAQIITYRPWIPKWLLSSLNDLLSQGIWNFCNSQSTSSNCPENLNVRERMIYAVNTQSAFPDNSLNVPDLRIRAVFKCSKQGAFMTPFKYPAFSDSLHLWIKQNRVISSLQT